MPRPPMPIKPTLMRSFAPSTRPKAGAAERAVPPSAAALMKFRRDT